MEGRNEVTQDLDMKMLTDAANQLGEYFDAVQIFASRYAPATDKTGDNATVAVSAGVGNDFARFGQVKTWVLENEADAARRKEKE